MFPTCVIYRELSRPSLAADLYLPTIAVAAACVGLGENETNDLVRGERFSALQRTPRGKLLLRGHALTSHELVAGTAVIESNVVCMCVTLHGGRRGAQKTRNSQMEIITVRIGCSLIQDWK